MPTNSPIITENRNPGTADWLLSNPALSREIEGYASATSVNQGDALALYVNTRASTFALEVFRLGWYQGLGARSVFGPLEFPGTLQVIPEMDPATGLVDCAWINPIVLASEQTLNWLSGVYLVKLTENTSGKQSYIIFVVHELNRRADLLIQQSVTTYQAYNIWGGKSLYKWGSSEHQRASKVSFNRPYAINPQNPAAAYGVGAGEFICNVQPHNPDYPISNAGWEINLLRWLEREGYDVAYCTNLDIHANPGLLHNYKAWLSVGHDEYWSWQMRNNLESALTKAMHLGFFSANTGYWQVRFEDSPASGQANRIMVCHKSATRDVTVKNSPQLSHLSTCQWREPPLCRPEAELLGVMYAADPIHGDLVISHAGHKLFAGTNLSNGDCLQGLLGYEVDSVHTSSPANIEILAASPWTKLNDANAQGVAHMTWYAVPSQARVFATGTMQWSWGLDDFNAPSLRPSYLNSAAQQITRNVLQVFIKPTSARS